MKVHLVGILQVLWRRNHRKLISRFSSCFEIYPDIQNCILGICPLRDLNNSFGSALHIALVRSAYVIHEILRAITLIKDFPLLHVTEGSTRLGKMFPIIFAANVHRFKLYGVAFNAPWLNYPCSDTISFSNDDVFIVHKTCLKKKSLLISLERRKYTICLALWIDYRLRRARLLPTQDQKI